MCVVSMVMDQFDENWRPKVQPPFTSHPAVGVPAIQWGLSVSRAEFDALKRDVEAIKELIPHLKRYDEATGQPDCEQEEKLALLRKLAEVVGVDLEEVLG